LTEHYNYVKYIDTYSVRMTWLVYWRAEKNEARFIF